MNDHLSRVAVLVGTLCECIGIGGDAKAEIVLSAHLHDIGKWWLPGSVLNKPGPLAPDEWRLVQEHTRVGSKMLMPCGLHQAAAVALCHHEAWDGSGYPEGIKGEAIPFPARVVTVCDVYSALREKRPYKGGLSHDAALNIMFEGDGRTRPEMFDPELLATFSDNHQRMSDVFSLADGSSTQNDAISNVLPFGCDESPDDPSALYA